MKILTWNINGIRASKTPLNQLFKSLDADVICLQETKVTRDQLDEPSAIVEGYNSYFSFSQVRMGYSGVATFVKDSETPVKAQQGLTDLCAPDDPAEEIQGYGSIEDFTDDEVEALEREGRSVVTQHKIILDNGDQGLLSIINVYCPRADPEREDRKIFKMRFYQLLQKRAEALIKEGNYVLILGDINTCHEPIDNCDPDEDEEFWKNPGRQWIHQLLIPPPEVATHDSNKSGGKFVDTFRYKHPTQTGAFTCWSTVTGARATNYGTRIDYILADEAFTKAALIDCIIMPEVEGSDHCPVKATWSCEILPEKKCPPFCTKYLPEFAGKQQKLSSFFTKSAAKHPPVTTSVSQNSSSGRAVTTIRSSASDSALPTKGTKRQGEGHNGGKNQKRAKQEKGGQKQSTLAGFFTKKSNTTTTSSSKEINVFTREKSVNQSCREDGDKGTHGNGDVTIKDQASDKSITVKDQVPIKSITVKYQVPDKSTTAKNQVLHKSTTVKDQIPDKSTLTKNTSSAWKSLLRGPAPPPPCKGHKEPCVLRTVKKDSLNKGRQFYVCARPEGHKSNPEARCDHFEWVEKNKKKTKDQE